MGVREWDRDMEMREDVYDGQPVYDDYVDAIHCPKILRENSIPLSANAMYYGGWDAGQTLSPAFVLLQVTERPWQVHALLEVVSVGQQPMERFAQVVLQRLMKWHPGLWDQVKHFGDATIVTRSGSDGQSARDVAKRHGISIVPMSNQWAGRVSAVTWLLTRRLDEDMPGFWVSGKDCPVLRDGFLGGYQTTASPSGESSGPGMVLRAPLKNAFSHVHDALQYAAIQIRKDIEKQPQAVLTRR